MSISMEYSLEEESKIQVSNMVRQLYFVKIWPFDDPKQLSRIKWAETLIHKMNQERAVLSDKYKTTQEIYLQLKYSPPPGEEWVKSVTRISKYRLDKLQRESEKLTIKGTGGKGAAVSQKIECIRIVDIWTSDWDIRWFNYYLMKASSGSQYGLRVGSNSRIKEILQEIKQCQDETRKAVVDAAQNGRIIKRLKLKKAMSKEIKLVNMILEELNKENSILMDQERFKGELVQSMCKELSLLSQQMDEIDRKKEEAEKCIHNSRKRREKANAKYKEYLSLMENVKELARKKEIAALEELARKEVDKFMFRWNHSKAFRNSYERREQSSLQNRGLSKDGRRMMNHDEEDTD